MIQQSFQQEFNFYDKHILIFDDYFIRKEDMDVRNCT